MSAKATGIKRILNAALYSWDGLRAAYQSEAAFRQELVLCAVAIPFAMWCDVTKLERVALIGSLLLVLMMEIINSALEATIDRISDEIHPLAKKAKDLGSAAVFLALVNAAIVWCYIILL